MPKGRKPLPQELLNLRDTARKDRLRPSSTLGEPIPPEQIRRCQTPGLKAAPPRARDIYWNLVKRFAAERILEADFLSQVLMYSVYLDTFISATEEIEAKGLICMGTNKDGAEYTYPNPAVSIRDKAAEKLLKIGSNFGLSPVDRQRLKVQAEDPKAKGLKAMLAMVFEEPETPDEQ